MVFRSSLQVENPRFSPDGLKFESRRRSWKEGAAEIAENEAKVAEAKIEYANGEEEAAQKIAEGEQKIADAEAKIQDIEKPTWYVYDRDTLTGVFRVRRKRGASRCNWPCLPGIILSCRGAD